MSNVNYELVKNRTIELSTCYYFPLSQKLANEKIDLLGHDLFQMHLQTFTMILMHFSFLPHLQSELRFVHLLCVLQLNWESFPRNTE